MAEDVNNWSERRFLARLVRTVALLAPITLAVGASALLSRWLPVARTTPGVVMHWALLGVVSTTVLVVVDRFARRLLPLAALLRLALVFPDRAPSRYKIARSVATTRQLEAEIARAREFGLMGDRERAAEMVLRLVAALSVHDRATRGHAERVRVFSDMIAEEMDLDEESVGRLRWASLLHDVGKIFVHPDVLNKPGRPTESEWEALRSHPLEGSRLAAPLRGWLGDWTLAIEQHHERWDGAGYPFGLSGREISLGARIVAVADSFEVMTAARPYKRPLTATAARADLARCSGSQFDPQVVRAFLSVGLSRVRWAVGPVSWLVNLPLVRHVPLQAVTPASAAAPGGLANMAVVATTALATTGVAAGVAIAAPGGHDVAPVAAAHADEEPASTAPDQATRDRAGVEHDAVTVADRAMQGVATAPSRPSSPPPTAEGSPEAPDSSTAPDSPAAADPASTRDAPATTPVPVPTATAPREDRPDEVRAEPAPSPDRVVGPSAAAPDGAVAAPGATVVEGVAGVVGEVASSAPVTGVVDAVDGVVGVVDGIVAPGASEGPVAGVVGIVEPVVTGVTEPTAPVVGVVESVAPIVPEVVSEVEAVVPPVTGLVGNLLQGLFGRR